MKMKNLLHVLVKMQAVFFLLFFDYVGLPKEEILYQAFKQSLAKKKSSIYCCDLWEKSDIMQDFFCQKTQWYMLGLQTRHH